jgi:O-antigen/teichoic acid export membrane protein
MFSFVDFAIMYILANLLSSICGVLLKRKDFVFGLQGTIKVKQMLMFSLPNTLVNFLHSIPKTLDVTILKYFFSTELVGIYGAARQLFRVFDEAINAVSPLVYSAYLKLKKREDKKAINDLVTKSTSFLLFAFATVVVLAFAGLTDWAIYTFLPERFARTSAFFTMMLLSGFGMPFILLLSVIVAMNEMKKATGVMLISIISYLLSAVLIGISGSSVLMPLSLVVYYTAVGLASYLFSRKSLEYRPIQIFRAIPDGIGFVKGISNKYLKK